MALIVQKYGGTSVAAAGRIKNVAQRIAARHAAGDKLVVVVSAMGSTTDDLLSLASQVSDHPEARELDVFLSHVEMGPEAPGEPRYRAPHPAAGKVWRDCGYL